MDVFYDSAFQQPFSQAVDIGVERFIYFIIICLKMQVSRSFAEYDVLKRHITKRSQLPY